MGILKESTIDLGWGGRCNIVEVFSLVLGTKKMGKAVGREE